MTQTQKYNLINKLFAEENKVPEHCRWQGLPYINKLNLCEMVSFKVSLFIQSCKQSLFIYFRHISIFSDWTVFSRHYTVHL